MAHLYHESESHLDVERHRQTNSKRSSPIGSKITKYETIVVDSNVTGCEKCSCNRKIKNKCTEIDDEPNNTPPGIGFSFAMCHLSLSQQADGFQLLVHSGSSKHFVDPELIREVESRMLEFTRIEPPMEITAAGDNVLRGTAQGILLVVVRGTDNVLRTVKLPMVLAPGSKRNLFSCSAELKKALKQSLKIMAHLSTFECLVSVDDTIG